MLKVYAHDDEQNLRKLLSFYNVKFYNNIIGETYLQEIQFVHNITFVLTCGNIQKNLNRPILSYLGNNYLSLKAMLSCAI